MCSVQISENKPIQTTFYLIIYIQGVNCKLPIHKKKNKKTVLGLTLIICR